METQPEGCQQVQAIKIQESFETLSTRKSAIGESEDDLGKDLEKDFVSGNVENEKGKGPAAPGKGQDEEQQPREPPFSIFTSSERRFIVVIASLAALFSPLSANIYYPALNTLSEELHESVTKINLTITTYLVRLSNTLVLIRAQCVTDLPRAGTHLHRKPFRRDRSTTFLHHLFCHLCRGKCWSGIASRLPYFARSTYGAELGKQWYCRSSQCSRLRCGHFRRPRCQYGLRSDGRHGRPSIWSYHRRPSEPVPGLESYILVPDGVLGYGVRHPRCCLAGDLPQDRR